MGRSETMKKAIKSKGSEAAYSSAQRQFEHWSAVGGVATSVQERTQQDASAHQIRAPEPGLEDSTSGSVVSRFNCAAGKHLWEIGWSARKKAWCCVHKNVGCKTHDDVTNEQTSSPPSAASIRPTTMAPTNPSYATTVLQNALTYRTPAPPETTTTVEASAAKPFNCLTKDNW